MPSHQFEADVRQILHLVTHSLYSDREIFLRELISNASDALDRARFESLQDSELRSVDGEPSIRISWNDEERTLTIADDGIGLTKEEAIEHLGTIAESGTKAFATALKEKGENPDGLIGQFGVGFYSDLWSPTKSSSILSVPNKAATPFVGSVMVATATSWKMANEKNEEPA